MIMTQIKKKTTAKKISMILVVDEYTYVFPDEIP